MKAFILIAAFLLCLPASPGFATPKSEQYSCKLNGTSSTYTRAEIDAVISAGGKCQRLKAIDTATCVIGNLAQRYAKSDVETVLQEHSDAVCMYDGGITVKAKKAIVGQKRAVATRLRIYFDIDSVDIEVSDDDSIASFADQFENSGTWLTITSHTDKSGSRAYNFKLSMQRADKVRRRLLVHGINPHEIIAVSAMGESATPVGAGAKGRVVIVRAYR